MDARFCKYNSYLQGCSPCNIHRLELVKSSEHTGTSNTSEDVGTSTLHQGHETFILANSGEAVNGALVLDTTSGGHHHAPPDSVNGVGHESRSDSHSPAEKEGQAKAAVISDKDWLQGVKQTKVHATVDEDTNGRDGEASVQALDTVRLEGLGIDINKSIELALTSLALGIIGQPGSGIVKRVHKQKRHGSSKATAGNVGGKLPLRTSILGGGKHCLDAILEGKVKSLGGEVSEHVGQVSSPERVDTLSLQYSASTVNNTLIRLVKSALLDHLILVLDKELDPLNGSSESL